MAKKKVKKKAKTPSRRGKITPSKPVSGRKRRKPKSVPLAELSDQVKSILLHQKISAVMKENPKIECTLVGEDEGRKFGICEASTVFRMYNQAMAKHGLTFIPIEVKPLLGSGCVLVRVSYQITDITTGWAEVVQSCGFGMNGQWSANTAMTLAYKQALLNTFTCSWPQPEDYRDEVQRVARKTFGPAQSPEQISEAIKEHFANFPLKGKKNATDSNRKKN